ncbi:MAG: hypothetical protein A3B99_00080 [Candidatus Yanofskybacteria bacterium RIFCSPHIGHO2_02_FULL_44_12b]|nr:MAG: hypothetical protein A3B99_00080 [Candidatus Yanofskybacteria bacterium RIFCSPHIGHO2_02_FULL_44_12b]
MERIKIKITKEWEPKETHSGEKSEEKRIETGERKPEILLPETLKFKREHLDITEFDPGWELREIRKLVSSMPAEVQSDQRRILMRDFKKKLAAMRENMMDAQIQIEQLLRKDPDLPWEQVEDAVQEVLVQNHVSLGEGFRQGMARYLEGRRDIKSVINRYKQASEEDSERRNWEDELFKDLFGRYPAGGLQIEQAPNSVYFHIYDLSDYVRAYLGREAENKREVLNLSTTGGSFIRHRFEAVPELSSKVIIENASAAGYLEADLDKTKTHEEEHAIHTGLYSDRLFDTSLKLNGIDLEIYQFMDQSVDLQDFLKWVKRYSKGVIMQLLGSAKTEILAYIREGRSVDDVRALLEEEDGIYNFYRDYNVDRVFPEYIIREIKSLSINLTVGGEKISEEELAEKFSGIVKEDWDKTYKNSLGLALKAAGRLLEMCGSDEEGRLKTIRLLVQEPIEKWSRLVRILS